MERIARESGGVEEQASASPIGCRTIDPRGYALGKLFDASVLWRDLTCTNLHMHTRRKTPDMPLVQQQQEYFSETTAGRRFGQCRPPRRAVDRPYPSHENATEVTRSFRLEHGTTQHTPAPRVSYTKTRRVDCTPLPVGSDKH